MSEIESTTECNGEQYCPLCQNTGIIRIYRGDWEEFDEVICTHYVPDQRG